MKKFFKIFVFFYIGLLAVGTLVCAERVTLKNGKVLEGKIIGYDDTALKIETEKGPYKADFKWLESIESTFGGGTDETVMNGVLERMEELNAARTKYIEELRARVMNKKIEMFGAPWCPSCRRMEKFFRKYGIEYTNYNIDYDIIGRKKYNALNGKGIPLVVIGDEVICGYSPDKVWAALLKK